MREQGRELRLAELLREELAGIIQLRMRDPRVGMVSVTDVRITKDFAYADVYVSALEGSDAAEPSAKRKDALVEVLNKAAGFFRSELAKRHSMRGTPKPRFHYDDSLARGRRLEKLIDQATAADRRKRSAPLPAGMVEDGLDDGRRAVQHGR